MCSSDLRSRSRRAFKADDPERLLLWVDVALKTHRLVKALRERERAQAEALLSQKVPTGIAGGGAMKHGTTFELLSLRGEVECGAWKRVTRLHFTLQIEKCSSSGRLQGFSWIVRRYSPLPA